MPYFFQAHTFILKKRTAGNASISGDVIDFLAHWKTDAQTANLAWMNAWEVFLEDKADRWAETEPQGGFLKIISVGILTYAGMETSF